MLFRSMLLGGVILLGLGCGKKSARKSTSAGTRSSLVRAFYEAAKTNSIPERLLIAVAYLESRLIPTASSASYLGLSLGPKAQQTAFGISKIDLAIDSVADSDELRVQIFAYAKWLKENIKNLPPKGSDSPDDQFAWIWKIADLHRSQHNTKAVFARELIDLLNRGFAFRDNETFEIIEFPKDKKPILVDGLQKLNQRLLTVDLRPSSQVRSTQWFNITGQALEPEKQIPKGIEIIHCPLNLSACLEMQVSEKNEDFWMEAHYIIGQSDLLATTALQVNLHDTAVQGISPDGNKSYSDGRVVIMLAGHSGKLVDGKRIQANPNWLTKWELKRLGQLVNDVCERIAIESQFREGELVLKEDCLKIGSGVKFKLSNPSSAEAHFGEIFDYDSSIFDSYIKFPDGLSSETVFEFLANQRIFKAGSTVAIGLSFARDVRYIEIEKLVRCPNQKIVWAPISADSVQNETHFQVEKRFWDAGPNLEGTQYLRAKVYGANNDLIGWDMDNLFIQKFNPTQRQLNSRACDDL